MPTATVQQLAIPDDSFGELTEYDGSTEDSDLLRSQLDEHGYVLFRDVMDRDEVLAAREEVFRRLEEVGEVKAPAIDGIKTNQSRRPEVSGGLHDFWRSVSEGPALRGVTHGLALHDIMSIVLGEPARAHDMMYVRPVPVGRSTKPHYDFPFFARRSLRIHTAWIPFGDTPLEDGPLLIIEGSNRFYDLIDPIREHDYDSNYADAVIQKAAYEKPNETDVITFARSRRARILSTSFRAGDLLVFGGFTLHGSLDNCSPIDRVRLSCDVRYQPASDPCDDERYFGANPTGSHGGGYGDMKGAKPLNEPW
ncbi:MAG: phytanoyl-CoA dioxygenase family protein [Planctomycetes bacterium]|nr:phytanoyl-CoA dioxygenase family protein [Planctomycetota bacterium]